MFPPSLIFSVFLAFFLLHAVLQVMVYKPDVELRPRGYAFSQLSVGVAIVLGSVHLALLLPAPASMSPLLVLMVGLYLALWCAFLGMAAMRLRTARLQRQASKHRRRDSFAFGAGISTTSLV
jgi:hypothetical protein